MPPHHGADVPPARGRGPRPTRVAVLIELERGPLAGGHVKCWERFAEAAAGVHGVDLTLYVLGDGPVESIAENVRFVPLRPLLSTRPLLRLVGGVDAADLAPWSPALARRLPQHDVWHLTHSLAFASTALRMARAQRRSLVGSVHTDLPMLTGIYAQQVVDRLGSSRAREALQRLRLPERAVASTRRRRDRVIAACGHVLVSNAADEAAVTEILPPERVSWLRRGVDTARFAPDPSARQRLAHRHGVPTDKNLVLFAGRVDATKGALLVAQAVRKLLSEGRAVHLVVAGSGADSERVRSLLGGHVTLLGPLPQPELAAVYPACDVLAFPSHTETAGNVVIEAMASGLPVVLPRGARTASWLRAPGQDGVLVDEHAVDVGAAGTAPREWARALAALLEDPARRAAMGSAARRSVTEHQPSWRQVLHEDLLPIWREAAVRTRRKLSHEPSRPT